MNVERSVELLTRYLNTWQWFPLSHCVWFRFDVGSYAGNIASCIVRNIAVAMLRYWRVNRFRTLFDFRPRAGTGTMLPPWAAYPSYSSVSGGWRKDTVTATCNIGTSGWMPVPGRSQTNTSPLIPIPDDDRLWPAWFESAVRPFLVRNRGVKLGGD